jgi:hypothetical protein
MKRISWQIVLALILVASSLSIYTVQIVITNRPNDTEFYFLQDLAFVPISVLLVTLIIDKLLSSREKESMMRKLNMVIGVFYSEVGTDLMKDCFTFDTSVESTKKILLVTGDWSDADYIKAEKDLTKSNPVIKCQFADLEKLKNFLVEKRSLMLQLLENPNLLEHESFTELLRAVFHLTEELTARKNLKYISDADNDHISGDIKRVYISLLSEWLLYMRHMKIEYPYLYSLAVRMNPFNPNAKAEIG